MAVAVNMGAVPLVETFVDELIAGYDIVAQHQNNLNQLSNAAQAMPHPDVYHEGSGLLFGAGNVDAADDLAYSNHSTTAVLHALFRLFPQIITGICATSLNLVQLFEVIRERINAFMPLFTGAPGSSSTATARACLDHLLAVFFSQRTYFFWKDLFSLRKMMQNQKFSKAERLAVRDAIVTGQRLDPQALHVHNANLGAPVFLAAADSSS